MSFDISKKLTSRVQYDQKIKQQNKIVQEGKNTGIGNPKQI